MFNKQDFFNGPDDPKMGKSVSEQQPHGSTFDRLHLCDAGTWSHREAIVAPQWPSDHPRIAVSIDDFGRASEAPGIRKHGTTVTHVDSRKPIDADRGPDGGKFQRTTEMIKLTGLNRYPTIVGPSRRNHSVSWE